MNGGKRILTVCYGAFSCRLEGFEDPFAAMRLVADHLREMTEDASRFGEAPLPDLARLSRGMGEGVEATVEGSELVLRARRGEAGESTAARILQLHSALARAGRPVPAAGHAGALVDPADLGYEIGEEAPAGAPVPRSASEGPAVAPAAPQPRPARRLPEAAGDDAVERILDKTAAEMSAPDRRRRTSALAHLKAAVAATVAGRLGPARDGGAGRMAAYREDLARAAPPAPDRPAPLVLAAEQRVDTFAAFARRVGARDPAGRIEAAAAYAALVEGKAEVSRAHLMQHLESLGAVPREEAMRAFGALVREGRLLRVAEGRFALAERSALRAAVLDSRTAG